MADWVYKLTFCSTGAFSPEHMAAAWIAAEERPAEERTPDGQAAGCAMIPAILEKYLEREHAAVLLELDMEWDVPTAVFQVTLRHDGLREAVAIACGEAEKLLGACKLSAVTCEPLVTDSGRGDDSRGEMDSSRERGARREGDSRCERDSGRKSAPGRGNGAHRESGLSHEIWFDKRTGLKREDFLQEVGSGRGKDSHRGIHSHRDSSRGDRSE